MRTLLRFLFSAVGLLAAASLVPGIHHQGFAGLVAVAVLLGALNATLGALLKAIAFLPVACTFGCFSLVINGLVFWFVGALAHRLGLGFQVEGFWAGFLGAAVTSLTAWALERLLLGPEVKEPPAPPSEPRGGRQVKILDPQ